MQPCGHSFYFLRAVLQANIRSGLKTTSVLSTMANQSIEAIVGTISIGTSNQLNSKRR